jgi:hypothetical protein
MGVSAHNNSRARAGVTLPAGRGRAGGFALNRAAPAAWIGLLAPLLLPAQDRRIDHNAHGWYVYNGDHPIRESRWGAHLEGQWRRHDVITKWQQLLLRPGVNYEVNDLLTLAGGYGFIRSHPYGDFPAASGNDEHRIWQQALLRYRTGRVGWATRLRFENRFIGVRDPERGDQDFRFENRFRALQQIRVPLSSRTYLTAYDELWFYVKPYVSSSVFDQNRAYAALGVNLDRYWRFEVGYLNQSLLQRSGRVLESNHTLMLVVSTNAPFGRRGGN